MNIYAIGDIHGCFDHLKELLTNLQYTPEDQLIFLGDYIDRGPNSYEVVEYLIQFQITHQNVVFLKGNHEDMMGLSLRPQSFSNDTKTWFENGGKQTRESYQKNGFTLNSWDTMPKSHAHFFQNLRMYYENNDCVFVHAGVPPWKYPESPLSSCSLDELLWIRWEFMESEKDFGKIIIFGHTPDFKVLYEKNKICIDTCCGKVPQGFLTALRLPDLIEFNTKHLSEKRDDN